MNLFYGSKVATKTKLTGLLSFVQFEKTTHQLLQLTQKEQKNRGEYSEMKVTHTWRREEGSGGIVSKSKPEPRLRFEAERRSHVFY